MKVKNVNSNAKKTEERIKDSFIKLLSKKKEINQITVTELVNDADLTRSSFYTHYDNLYEVARDIQNDTIAEFVSDNQEFNNYDDVCNYIDNTIILLKNNEKMYRMLASSYDTIYFFDEIRNTFTKRMYSLLLKSGINKKNIMLDINFFMDGLLFQIIKYFRHSNNDYSLEDIGERVKIWLKELFL